MTKWGVVFKARIIPETLHVKIENEVLRLAVDIALGTGLRVSEVASLRIEQFRPDTNIVRIKRKGGVEQDIYFPEPLMQKIRDYIQRRWSDTPSGWLLCIPGTKTKVSRYWLSNNWRLTQKDQGIKQTYRFHDLRHTAITRFLEASQDPSLAQVFAGHRSINTTMFYVHINPKKVQEAQEKMYKKINCGGETA